MMCIHHGYSRNMPENIIAHLNKNLRNPYGEIHSRKTNGVNLYDFVKDYRDELVPFILSRDPRDIVVINVAVAAGQCSDPRDYLIIVTQFLNEVANEKFDIENDQSIVSALMMPISDQMEGLIAMNYQIPELNEALRKAAPRFKPLYKEWAECVLCGELKAQPI